MIWLIENCHCITPLKTEQTFMSDKTAHLLISPLYTCNKSLPWTAYKMHVNYYVKDCRNKISFCILFKKEFIIDLTLLIEQSLLLLRNITWTCAIYHKGLFSHWPEVSIQMFAHCSTTEDTCHSSSSFSALASFCGQNYMLVIRVVVD